VCLESKGLALIDQRLGAAAIQPRWQQNRQTVSEGVVVVGLLHGERDLDSVLDGRDALQQLLIASNRRDGQLFICIMEALMAHFTFRAQCFD
jgi:hypothetical protein